MTECKHGQPLCKHGECVSRCETCMNKWLPDHISLTIQHNPHRADYMAVETWMDYATQSAMAGGFSPDEAIRPEDRSEIVRTQEIWVISWYPQTPVGSREVIAATLERALELAMETEK